jgi:hypothetical protein
MPIEDRASPRVPREVDGAGSGLAPRLATAPSIDLNAHPKDDHENHLNS